MPDWLREHRAIAVVDTATTYEMRFPNVTNDSHYAFLVNGWFLQAVAPSSRFRKGNQ
jgi:hypothetical protein